MVLRKNPLLRFTKKEEIMGQSKQNYGLEVLLYPYRFNEEKTRHRQTEGCTDT